MLSNADLSTMHPGDPAPLDIYLELTLTRYVHYNDARHLKRAIQLIKDRTYNVRWYDSFALALRSIDRNWSDNSGWREAAVDTYNAEARHLREEYHQASASGDLQAVAAASIKEGHWHINGGDFRFAHGDFNQARDADKARELECMFYSSQLDVIQREFSLLATTLGRQFSRILARMNEPYASGILLTYALSLWKYHEFAACAAVLLHLPAALQNPAKLQWNWLTKQQLATLTVVCSLLSLSRANIEFLLTGDLHFGQILAEFPYLSALIRAYLDLEIEEFWKCWSELAANNRNPWLLDDELLTCRAMLRNNLHRMYLAVRSVCPVDQILAVFGITHRTYTILDFVVEVSSLDLQIEVDTVTNIVRTVKKPAMTDMHVDQYVHDSLMTIWYGIETSFNGVITTSQEREPKSRFYATRERPIPDSDESPQLSFEQD